MRFGYPRFSIRTLLLATAFVAAGTPLLIVVVKSRSTQDGIVIFGDSPHPSENEIRAAIRNQGYVLPSESVGVFQEKIADYVDPPTRIPVLGKFQRHHKHYRFGLRKDENPGSLPVIIVKRSAVRWVK